MALQAIINCDGKSTYFVLYNLYYKGVSVGFTSSPLKDIAFIITTIFFILLFLYLFRYIIIHVGSENGFVPNAEMNKSNFTKWVTKKLILNLPKSSTIVMDTPTILWFLILTSELKVDDIKQWL